MAKKNLLIYVVAFVVMTAFVWFTPDRVYSDSERRPLAKQPELNSALTASFETYTADQFPFRDVFRGIKNNVLRTVFLRADVNGLYRYDDQLCKLDYPLNGEMVSYFKKLFETIFRNNGITNGKLLIVPDKNSYTDRPAIDVGELGEMIGFETIDVSDLLTLDDYYRTDSHWKNECLEDVAGRVLENFGKTAEAAYELRKLDSDFKGVYVGQSLYKTKADKIGYLYSPIFEELELKDYQKKDLKLFDETKAFGKDPYDFFMEGAQPYIEITNKANDSGAELVVFRDSYGSSLIPLLTPAYSKIYVFDLRYLNSALINNFVEFNKDQDVLLVYSTTVINSAIALK